MGEIYEDVETPVHYNQISFSRLHDDTLLITFSGSWRLQDGLPATTEVQQQIDTDPPVRHIAFDARQIHEWDSSLLIFLNRIFEQCAQRHVDMDRQGLPQGVRRLLDLASAVPERQDARREVLRDPVLSRIGKGTLAARQASMQMLGFVGEAAIAFSRLLRGKARFRHADFALIIQDCGAQALPIVSLVSFLVGLIMAFIGAVQLRQFGAQIYVADLVGLGMAREMGAMMTAIIMAGRSGAAFAAQLGTMMVNEEIDALKTLGISPMEFLVLPRMLALMLMMPLLCLYADLLGILGGMAVGVGMLDLGFLQYLNETQLALSLGDFAGGLIKSAVYGVLVALAGCMRGMQCGRSASAVGAATTSAVVTSIVFIVIASAILTLIYNVLGF